MISICRAQLLGNSLGYYLVADRSILISFDILRLLIGIMWSEHTIFKINGQEVWMKPLVWRFDIDRGGNDVELKFYILWLKTLSIKNTEFLERVP
ncbi:MAG: hypothetical protein H0W50_11575 [Parachlamydiaceae bacterium]|nr:hypothetical protein [Parachlamydiaceae bacterium]